MARHDSLTSKKKVRRDGGAALKAPAARERRWNVGGGSTPERQLRFLDSLERTRSVTKAARAAAMSRESAYRLRTRPGNALFAVAWDKALRLSEGHEVCDRTGRIGRLRPVVSRANPPKVTKWRKCTTPRFDPFEKILRDLLNDSLPSGGAAD